jgi:hypothetical protein
MWFKIDPHELAVFIAVEGKPMGDWEKDMYAAARRQAEAMLRRSAKRGFGVEKDAEPAETKRDPVTISQPRLRHRKPEK